MRAAAIRLFLFVAAAASLGGEALAAPEAVKFPVTVRREQLTLDGKLYRIAQDGSGEYGRNISILEITDLTRTSYSETVVADHYFELEHSWNHRGGHHLSIAKFNGKTVIAVDGKQDDMWINKVLAPFYKYFAPVLAMIGIIDG